MQLSIKLYSVFILLSFVNTGYTLHNWHIAGLDLTPYPSPGGNAMITLGRFTAYNVFGPGIAVSAFRLKVAGDIFLDKGPVIPIISFLAPTACFLFFDNKLGEAELYFDYYNRSFLVIELDKEFNWQHIMDFGLNITIKGIGFKAGAFKIAGIPTEDRTESEWPQGLIPYITVTLQWILQKNDEDQFVWGRIPGRIKKNNSARQEKIDLQEMQRQWNNLSKSQDTVALRMFVDKWKYGKFFRIDGFEGLAIQQLNIVKNKLIQDDWQLTRQMDALNGYRHFLESFGDSTRYSEEAHQRIVKLMFDSALTGNSVNGYRHFLESCGDMTYYSEDAHRRIEQIIFDSALTANSIEALSTVAQHHSKWLGSAYSIKAGNFLAKVPCNDSTIESLVRILNYKKQFFPDPDSIAYVITKYLINGASWRIHINRSSGANDQCCVMIYDSLEASFTKAGIPIVPASESMFTVDLREGGTRSAGNNSGVMKASFESSGKFTERAVNETVQYTIHITIRKKRVQSVVKLPIKCECELSKKQVIATVDLRIKEELQIHSVYCGGIREGFLSQFLQDSAVIKIAASALRAGD